MYRVEYSSENWFEKEGIITLSPQEENNMQKILIITNQCPADASIEGGVGCSIYWMIKHCADIDIDLLYVGKKMLLCEQHISEYVNNVIHIPAKERGKLESLLIGIVKRYPRISASYDCSIISDTINKLMNLHEYDEVIVTTYVLVDLLNYLKEYNPIFYAIDSLALNYHRKIKCEKNVCKKIFDYIQYIFSLHIEEEIAIPRSKKIVYVSEVDQDYAIGLSPSLKNKISSIRHGVEIPTCYEKNIYDGTKFNIVFTGQMGYHPNKDAVLYFVKDVLPILIEKMPNIHFYIVGANADAEIKSLQSGNVTVTGFVENIYSYIASADIYVSPLRYGTGIKNKILEAMSCGRPIVASYTSIEGIEYIEEKINYLRADEVGQWMECIYALYCDKKKRDSMGKNNLKLAMECFSWNNTLKNMLIQ